jgi:Ca2+-binding RTX toxin-like protein
MGDLYIPQNELTVGSNGGDVDGMSAIAHLTTGGFAIAWADAASAYVQRYDASGTPVGGPTLVFSGISSRTASDVTITGLDGGGYVVAWETDDQMSGSSANVRARVYDAAGLPVGDAFSVSTSTPRPERLPDLAALEGGGFLATWTGGDLTSSNTPSDVYARIFTATGTPVAAPFLVNSVTANNQRDSAATGLPDGGFAIAYQHGGDQSQGGSIYVERFDSGGNRVGDPFVTHYVSFSGQTRIEGSRPAIATLESGGFVVTWVTNYTQFFSPTKSEIRGTVFDAAGQPVLSNFLIDQAGELVAPAVSALPSGGFVVTWTDQTVNLQGGDIRGRTYDASGLATGEEFRVNATAAGQQWQPDVAVLTSGDLVASWSDDPSDTIRARMFERVEAPSDLSLSDSTINEAHIEELIFAEFAPNTVGSDEIVYTLIADSSGGAFRIADHKLVLSDNTKLDFETAPQVSITVRATSASGASYDETFVIDVTDTADEIRYDAGADIELHGQHNGDQTNPSIAAFGSGYVAVWQTGTDIHGMYYDAGGNRIGSEFVVAGTANSETAPEAAALSGGRYVVMYHDSGFNPYAKVYGADGSVVRDAFPVAATGSGQYGAITGLEGGGFVAAWWGGTWPNTGAQIRLFDNDGTPLSGDLLVNRGVLGRPFLDFDLAALSDGGFALASYNSGSGVVVQQFDRWANAVGEPTSIAGPNGSYANVAIAGLEFGGYVVTWTQQDSDGVNVYAQIFDSRGLRVGPRFDADPVAEGTHYDADVTAFSWGGFAISWTSAEPRGTDEFGSATMLQLFDSLGQRIGDAVVATDRTAGSQYDSALATLSGDRFVLGWTDGSGDGGGASSLGVRGRMFVPDPAVNRTAAARGDRFETEENVILGPGRSLFADNGNGADTDPNRASPVVVQVNGSAANVGQTITLASGALLRVNADGTFSYDPNGAFDHLADRNSGASNISATDGFTYRIADGPAAPVSITIYGDYSQGDTLIGTNASETIIGSPFDETLQGLGGDDKLYGGGGADVLIGGFGADLLDGDFGDDRMEGGFGNDSYVVLDAGDVVVEAASGGIDEVRTTLSSYTIPANVESVVYIGTGDFHGTGGAAADRFRGGAGNDDISTGGGNDIVDLSDGGDDTVDAGAGDDVLFFGGALTAADDLDGGDGTDTLVLQGNYPALALGAGSLAGIEGISLQSGSITRWGQSGTNSYDYNLTMHNANVAAGQQLRVNAQSLLAGEDFTFDGSAETNGRFLVYGGFGIDTLTGGAGNDIFYFEAGRLGAGDKVNGGGGNDAVVISGAPAGTTGPAQIDIQPGTFTGIEALSFNGRFASEPGARPSYDVVLRSGNIAPGATLIVNASSLDPTQSLNFEGGFVTDGLLQIFGGAGHDRLRGGANGDIIHGGGGGDHLIGNGGADTFRYLSVNESNGVTVLDLISFFETGADRIDLAAVDANKAAAGDQAFSWIGSNAFSGTAGELRATFDAGSGRWTVQGDVDGNGSAEFVLLVEVFTGLAPLSASDFVL